MRSVSAALSDIGRRRAANEDAFAVDESHGVFVVADGLGGHVAGRTASETAVEHFVQRIRCSSGQDRLEAMRSAVRGANAAILDRVRAVPYLKGMGTTLAAVRISEGRVTFANVGDSRIYLLRDDVLYPITLDHSYVCELVFRGRIKPEAARTHPHRHVITRALGVYPPAEPDLGEIALCSGDLLALCTDGITAAIADAEVRQILVGGCRDLHGAATALVSCANARGGHDNATIVLVRVLG